MLSRIGSSLIGEKAGNITPSTGVWYSSHLKIDLIQAKIDGFPAAQPGSVKKGREREVSHSELTLFISEASPKHFDQVSKGNYSVFLLALSAFSHPLSNFGNPGVFVIGDPLEDPTCV